MAIYEFRCKKCKENYEYILKKLRHKFCPKCKSEMSLIISRVGLEFKGSGWTPKFY